MLESTLSGLMDESLIEQLQKVAQTFLGKQVKIVIQESNGEEKRRRKS